MKTYLTVFFASDGAKPSQVTESLMNLGFKPTKGNYDYVYDWGDVKELKEIIWFGDRVHAALAESRVLFKLETV